MPGFPLTIVSGVSCFHQAPATVAPAQQAVAILGQPVATANSQIAVVGCLFNVGGASHPCVLIRWTMPSTKVLVLGQPLLLMPPPGAGIGPGICQAADQAPQGTPVVRANQQKVFAV